MPDINYEISKKILKILKTVKTVRQAKLAKSKIAKLFNFRTKKKIGIKNARKIFSKYIDRVYMLDNVELIQESEYKYVNMIKRMKKV